ncbi:RNAse P, Rpr2/Rpp21 subunit [Quillaja saponaria]|uniref:RNAse P, Rpr2/Rpp21 subunit n=1 Tax=Quillaja saponaria TaxID=32244 RepID=A0AAD7L686_QUISA|nr:RNAse P, Rpr2/Rpp21 subunit [Quillaja saponaria]KAJ7952309.1 RNAse P, Rpr2/Rpp21 subunit [Quillaja saponaria]
MGKRGKEKKTQSLTSCIHTPISLREESTGKVERKGGVNTKSMLKFDHLQKLAVWSSAEASITSLAAFFGNRLASVGEAMGIPPSPSLFPCQRCETVLQPGHNCTIRIEPNRAKARNKRKKSLKLTQNNMVYKCHFCSHLNLKRGAPKGYMKEIYPAKTKSSVSKAQKTMLFKSSELEKGIGSKDGLNEQDLLASPAVQGDIPIMESPATPSLRNVTTLLETKRRKRSASKKAAGPAGITAPADAEKTGGSSSKRRRKSWTSLKEIAQSSGHDNSRSVANLTIPFFL